MGERIKAGTHHQVNPVLDEDRRRIQTVLMNRMSHYNAKNDKYSWKRNSQPFVLQNVADKPRAKLLAAHGGLHDVKFSEGIPHQYIDVKYYNAGARPHAAENARKLNAKRHKKDHQNIQSKKAAALKAINQHKSNKQKTLAQSIAEETESDDDTPDEQTAEIMKNTIKQQKLATETLALLKNQKAKDKPKKITARQKQNKRDDAYALASQIARGIEPIEAKGKSKPRPQPKKTAEELERIKQLNQLSVKDLYEQRGKQSLPKNVVAKRSKRISKKNDK